MKPQNVGTLIREREDMHDLLEDIMERIQGIQKEMLTELDDLKGMIAKNSGIAFQLIYQKVHV